jgi:hypothetical protein
LEVECLTGNDSKGHPVELTRQPKESLSISTGFSQPVEREVRGGEQRVSSIDRLGISPKRPNRVSMAAGGASILDVIVYEREIMEELNCRGERRRFLRPSAGGGAAE